MSQLFKKLRVDLLLEKTGKKTDIDFSGSASAA